MDYLNFDLSLLLTLENLLVIFLGTFVGMLFGAIPGLGAMITIVLLFPLTYMLSPLAAILLLLAAYQAAEYGGSISSITLGIPGTPAAVATVLDGHTMAKQHSPGKALKYALTGSVVGGLIGALVLIFLAGPIAKFALNFTASEFFLVGLLAVLAVSAVSSKSIIKSMISMCLGLLLGTVGMDMFSATSRFTFGRIELFDGIDLVALIVGMFAFSEVFTMISNGVNKKHETDLDPKKSKITLKEYKEVVKPAAIGSVTGSIIGIIPGMGAATASWIAYSTAKKYSKKPEMFGKGNPEGIVAPESANNASVGGAILPLLTLGIPGSPSIAIIMGAFIVHGIQPGPSVFNSEPALVNGILFGFLFTTIALYIMARIFTPLFSRILVIPSSFLIPSVILLSLIGVYVNNMLFFEVWFALIVGIIAFYAKKIHYSLPAFVLAFILSPIIEENFRRALLISDGDLSVFVRKPASLILCIIIVFILATPLVKFIKDKVKKGTL